MSGRGQKRELRQLLSHLKQMLGFLGQDNNTTFAIKLDEFQQQRRQFTKAAKQYEKFNNKLNDSSSRQERQMIKGEVLVNHSIMDRSLRNMMQDLLRLNNKVNGKNKDKGIFKGEKQGEKTSQEKDLEYKSLIVYQLQATYFKLTKKQHREVVRMNKNQKQNITLEQLKLRKPLNRGFSQISDHESAQYIQQQQILQAIHHVDNMIEQKMDCILQGLRTLNYNAVTISQSLSTVHKKIIVNMDCLDENLKHMEQAEKLLEEASPLVSKPNCILNVIIVALLGILVYFIVKKVWGSSST